jgi:hypothetical protein
LGSHAGAMVVRFVPQLRAILRQPAVVPVASTTGGGNG